MCTIVRSFYLGRLAYSEALCLQQRLVDLHRNAKYLSPHTILLLEHQPVYTVGIRSRVYTEDEINRVKSTGAEFHKTGRGGLITYHGPGQLTAYPILNLQCHTLLGRGLRWYVGALEESGMRLCYENFRLRVHAGSQLTEHGTGAIGVWLTEKQKLMTIGIQRAGSITYHGVGLNCTNEPLPWFDEVIPCGLSNCKMVSLTSATGKQVTVKATAPKLARTLFSNLFHTTLSESPDAALAVHEYNDFSSNGLADADHTICDDVFSRVSQAVRRTKDEHSRIIANTTCT